MLDGNDRSAWVNDGSMSVISYKAGSKGFFQRSRHDDFKGGTGKCR